MKQRDAHYSAPGLAAAAPRLCRRLGLPRPETVDTDTISFHHAQACEDGIRDAVQRTAAVLSDALDGETVSGVMV